MTPFRKLEALSFLFCSLTLIKSLNKSQVDSVITTVLVLVPLSARLLMKFPISFCPSSIAPLMKLLALSFLFCSSTKMKSLNKSHLISESAAAYSSDRLLMRFPRVFCPSSIAPLMRLEALSFLFCSSTKIKSLNKSHWASVKDCDSAKPWMNFPISCWPWSIAPLIPLKKFLTPSLAPWSLKIKS